MKKLMFAFFAATLMAVSVDAQTDAVTNRDLEKYQAERLKAEADLRENYKRLGFPSPEELKRRSDRIRQRQRPNSPQNCVPSDSNVNVSKPSGERSHSRRRSRSFKPVAGRNSIGTTATGVFRDTPAEYTAKRVISRAERSGQQAIARGRGRCLWFEGNDEQIQLRQHKV